MSQGIERAPVHSLNAGPPISPAGEASAAAFGRIIAHAFWVNNYLGIGGEHPFQADAAALEDRRKHIRDGQELRYHAARDIKQLGTLVVATVDQIEAEFANQTVLDIGCGTGRLGEELRRRAKAKVTFLDQDESVMDGITLKSGCNKVVADARELPFEDESFARTLNIFSAIHWAETPHDRVQAFNETLRVTEVGGSALIVPAFASLKLRHKIDPDVEEVTVGNATKNITITQKALKMWALQDHVLLHAMMLLAGQEYCSITWSDNSTYNPREIDNYSAIIDKHRPIPPKVMATNLAYAARFAASNSDTSS